MSIIYLAITILIFVISSIITHSGINVVFDFMIQLLSNFNLSIKLDSFINANGFGTFVYIVSFLQSYYISRFVSRFIDSDELIIINKVALIIGNSFLGCFISLMYLTLPNTVLSKIFSVVLIALVILMLIALLAIAFIYFGPLMGFVAVFGFCGGVPLLLIFMLEKSNGIPNAFFYIILIILMLILVFSNPIIAGIGAPIISLFLPLLIFGGVLDFFDGRFSALLSILVWLFSYPICSIADYIVNSICGLIDENYSLLVESIYFLFSLSLIVLWFIIVVLKPNMSTQYISIGDKDYTLQGVDIIVKGYWGNNGTWELYRNGMLVIDGDYDICDYSANNAPWQSYKDKIIHVTFGDTIEKVGSYCLYDCKNLVDIQLPDNLYDISINAIECCPSLNALYLKKGNETFYTDKGVLFKRDPKVLWLCPEKITKDFMLEVAVSSSERWYEGLLSDKSVLYSAPCILESKTKIEYSRDYNYYSVVDSNHDGIMEVFLSTSKKPWSGDKILLFTWFDKKIVTLAFVSLGAGGYYLLYDKYIILCSRAAGVENYDIYTLDDSNLEKILSLHKDNFSIDETTGKQAMTYEINNKKVSKERYAECYLKYIEDAQEVIYKEKR